MGMSHNLNMKYGDVCLLVRIGWAGERLAYPTAAEVREEAKKERKR
jgi:hypothetical protein